MRMIGTNIIETERCILRKIQLSDYQMMYENWAKYEEATDILMIAKYFERIGDHATNIAEWVIYSLIKYQNLFKSHLKNLIT